jgi:hypothetical protein
MQDSERLDAPTGLPRLHTSIPADVQDVETSTHASTVGERLPETAPDASSEYPVPNAVTAHITDRSNPSSAENTQMYTSVTQQPSNVGTHLSDKHFVNTSTHSESSSPAEVAWDPKQHPWSPSLIRFGPLTGIIGRS